MHCRLYVAGAVVAMTLAGCHKDPKARLVGKWVGETVLNVPEAQKADAEAWAKSLQFRFKDNTMMVAVPSEEPRSGKYEVEDSKDSKVVVRVARETGATDQATLAFDGDKLHWDVGDGRQVVLARAE